VKRAFVLGHPISHSRSPLIHGHWIEQYGIPGSYEPIDVTPEALPAFFGRIRAGEFVGGNVTVPLKELAFGLCDTHDVDTVHLRATNTLSTMETSDGRMIHGANTDQYGFLANLDAAVPGWSEGQRKAIVIGAGGAARAVASALSISVCRTYILNRTPGRAAALVKELGAGSRLAARELAAWRRLAPSTHIVVNTTTVGMHGTAFDDLPLELLPRDALVTDIVYVPLVTPFLAEARRLGLRTVDGLGMLLHQAVPGFEAWFGVRPEVTPELRAKIEATLT
jgi:shikimate dehydrogenase